MKTMMRVLLTVVIIWGILGCISRFAKVDESPYQDLAEQARQKYVSEVFEPFIEKMREETGISDLVANVILESIPSYAYKEEYKSLNIHYKAPGFKSEIIDQYNVSDRTKLYDVMNILFEGIRSMHAHTFQYGQEKVIVNPPPYMTTKMIDIKSSQHEYVYYLDSTAFRDLITIKIDGEQAFTKRIEKELKSSSSSSKSVPKQFRSNKHNYSHSNNASFRTYEGYDDVDDFAADYADEYEDEYDSWDDAYDDAEDMWDEGEE